MTISRDVFEALSPLKFPRSLWRLDAGLNTLLLAATPPAVVNAWSEFWFLEMDLARIRVPGIGDFCDNFACLTFQEQGNAVRGS
jgi:hypothetical protein